MNPTRIALGFAFFIMACSSSSTGGDGGGAPGAFAQPCGAGDACASGLVCAKGGFAPGLCTQTCKDTSECQVKLGDNAKCDDGECVMKCDAAHSCPAGSSCFAPLGYCELPSPNTLWTCETTGGVCTCEVDPAGSATASCPKFTLPGLVCCQLLGPDKDPATWSSCICQDYSSIPSGASCYTLPLARGLNYGVDVPHCAP